MKKIFGVLAFALLLAFAPADADAGKPAFTRQFSDLVLVQAPTPAPGPYTRWFVIKHVRFPIASDDTVAGPYPDAVTCSAWVSYYQQHPQWWTEYSCEPRLSPTLRRKHR